MSEEGWSRGGRRRGGDDDDDDDEDHEERGRDGEEDEEEEAEAEEDTVGSSVETMAELERTEPALVKYVRMLRMEWLSKMEAKMRPR